MKPEWNLVAAQLMGRTGKQVRGAQGLQACLNLIAAPSQVRERYINHLDPTIKRGPFLPVEVSERRDGTANPVRAGRISPPRCAGPRHLGAPCVAGRSVGRDSQVAAGPH